MSWHSTIIFYDILLSRTLTLRGKADLRPEKTA